MATKAAGAWSGRLADGYDETVRFLKKKIAAVDLFDETLAERATTNPWYALGSMVYLFWLITIASGVLLIMWYIPNTSRAYDSIIHIQESIRGGWLIRGLHKYGADAVIIAAAMRVYRLYFTGEYKRHEIAWTVAVVTLIAGMFSGLTGYLLIWNQRAFWASKVFATFPTYLDDIPGVGLTHFGMTQAQFLLGGTAIGEATMTRFYAGHLAISFLALILVEAYFIRTGHRRINLGWLGVAICTLMLVSVAMLIPAELGSRSNRAETPLPILSDWYFLGLYQMMKEMKPLYAVVLTPVIPLVVVLLPFCDKAKDVSTTRRPFFLWLGLAGFVYWIVFSVMIILNWAEIATDPPKIWGSFILMLVASACFEFRAMGYPRRGVILRCGAMVALWAVTFVTFGAWTRFRRPEHAASYYPPGLCRVSIEADAKARDAANDTYRGDDATKVVDDIGNALRKPLVTKWYVPDQEQLEKLLANHASVRGWWIMMTVILLLCAALAVSGTPPKGIESEIWPTRTDKGKRIKGLPLETPKREAA